MSILMQKNIKDLRRTLNDAMEFEASAEKITVNELLLRLLDTEYGWLERKLIEQKKGLAKGVQGDENRL